MIRKSTPSSAKNNSPCNGVDDIGSQGFRSKPKGGQNAFPRKVGIGLEKVFHRFAGGHLLKEHLHGDAGSPNDRLAHHDVGVRDDLRFLASHREEVLGVGWLPFEALSGTNRQQNISF